MQKKLLLIVLSVLSLASCNNNAVSKESYDVMYNHMVDMWANSLNGVHYDSAFYGDSRIAGGDFASQFESENTVNLGVGGDKVQNLIDRFKLVEAVSPKYLFISIGGNDAISSSFNEEVFKTAFDNLINKVKTINTKVVLNTNPAIRGAGSISQKDAAKANAKIIKTNSYIKSVANDNGYYLIDIASKMNDSEGYLNAKYTIDGVHYNSEGYDVWFNEISLAFIAIKD